MSYQSKKTKKSTVRKKRKSQSFASEINISLVPFVYAKSSETDLKTQSDAPLVSEKEVVAIAITLTSLLTTSSQGVLETYGHSNAGGAVSILEGVSQRCLNNEQ